MPYQFRRKQKSRKKSSNPEIDSSLHSAQIAAGAVIVKTLKSKLLNKLFQKIKTIQLTL